MISTDGASLLLWDTWLDFVYYRYGNDNPFGLIYHDEYTFDYTYQDYMNIASQKDTECADIPGVPIVPLQGVKDKTGVFLLRS